MFSNATNNYFHLDRHFYSLEFRLFTTFLNKTGRLKTIELAPKSWTLIKAYSGALCKLGSVCDRTQLFQFQTATLAVVVIHIVIYLFHQFVHRQFPCVIETLRLQHRKEAFHRRIVPTIRLSRHALNHGMLRKQFPIGRQPLRAYSTTLR